MTKTRYPTWDVMAAREEWDEHTRSVIAKRMEEPGPPAFFTPDESAVLQAAVARLVADDDPWMAAKVAAMIDAVVGQGPGDNYRQTTMPPDKELWRQILARLGPDFASLAPDQQDQRLTNLQQGHPQHFKALHKEVVSHYCALPPVWSFMGYGGPAFPRGYVRIELGLQEPWEPEQAGPDDQPEQGGGAPREGASGHE